MSRNVAPHAATSGPSAAVNQWNVCSVCYGYRPESYSRNSSETCDAPPRGPYNRDHRRLALFGRAGAD